MIELPESIQTLLEIEPVLLILKLILSALIGTLIGFERESHGQAAGLRTYSLVCLAGCLLMILSLSLPELFSQLTDDSVVRVDPSRIASYAVAGMGFLGAGAIIKGRGAVRGLTTAAGLWLVTAIGLTIGAGMFTAAILTTLISLPVLYNLRLVRPIIRRDERTLLTVRCCCEDRPLKRIKSILAEEKKIDIEFITYRENREDLEVTYIFRLMSKDDANWGEIVAKLLTINSILEIAWEQAEVP